MSTRMYKLKDILQRKALEMWVVIKWDLKQLVKNVKKSVKATIKKLKVKAKEIYVEIKDKVFLKWLYHVENKADLFTAKVDKWTEKVFGDQENDASNIDYPDTDDVIGSGSVNDI